MLVLFMTHANVHEMHTMAALHTADVLYSTTGLDKNAVRTIAALRTVCQQGCCNASAPPGLQGTTQQHFKHYPSSPD